MKTRPKIFLKFTPLNARLFQYIRAFGAGRRDKVLEALRVETARFGKDAEMQIGPDQGAFLSMLVAAIAARSAIEVGTFTGYSSICIARALPPGGTLLCLDASQEWTDVARRYWARAKLEGKIELRLGPALDSLKNLEAGRRFDFAFIDARKREYDAYYELNLPRMRANGLILFDNMLSRGRLGGKGPAAHPNARAIDRLNRKLARDKRVESVLLSIGDGLRMCRVLEQ